MAVAEVVPYVESDESKRAAVLVRLDSQLKELKREVTTIEPIIKENVRSEVLKVEDVLLLRYSQLQNEDNLREIFKGFPVMSLLIDAASSMISAMNATEELTEILRWQQRKLIKRVGGEVIGMEVHYKVKILEETKGWVGSRKKETVVLVAYKAIASVMNLNPCDYPDAKELAQ